MSFMIASFTLDWFVISFDSPLLSVTTVGDPFALDALSSLFSSLFDGALAVDDLLLLLLTRDILLFLEDFNVSSRINADSLTIT